MAGAVCEPLRGVPELLQEVQPDTLTEVLDCPVLQFGNPRVKTVDHFVDLGRDALALQTRLSQVPDRRDTVGSSRVAGTRSVRTARLQRGAPQRQRQPVRRRRESEVHRDSLRPAPQIRCRRIRRRHRRADIFKVPYSTSPPRRVGTITNLVKRGSRGRFSRFVNHAGKIVRGRTATAHVFSSGIPSRTAAVRPIPL